jgi:hypothetical protein
MFYKSPLEASLLVSEGWRRAEEFGFAVLYHRVDVLHPEFVIRHNLGCLYWEQDFGGLYSVLAY